MDTKKNSGLNTSLRSGVSYRASLGYLMGVSNFNYGAELGYTGYPDNTYSNGYNKLTYSGHTIDLLGVGKYNFSNTETGFFAVGKAGAAYVSQKTKANNFNKTQTAIKPELAVGLGYNMSRKVALDVTMSRIFAGQANPTGNSVNSATQVSSVNTLMAGITYNFS
jgi:hypothetical protein